MAALNPLTSELVFKIVFYGPGLGGKTTTLQYIHAQAKPEHRGSMVSLATEAERTLYFDFLPLQVLRLQKLTVRLQLFTVPGQVYYGATRKLVLSGADGIVFVADSQNARIEANQESLDDLNANLLEQGRALSRVPHQFHWNKRDLPDVTPVADLDRRLNLFSAPALETVATNGTNVFRGLEQITRAVFNAFKAELPSEKKAGGPLFLDAEEVGLADAIRDLADSRPAKPSSQTAHAPSSQTAHAPSSQTMLAPSSETMHAPSSETMHAPFAAAAQAQPPTLSPPTAAAFFSLADFWPEAEREAVRRAEALVAARDAPSAVVACDALLTETIRAARALFGEAAPDAATVALLLGVDGPRYLAFVAAVRRARARGEVTAKQALECFAVALDAQRALARALA